MYNLRATKEPERGKNESGCNEVHTKLNKIKKKKKREKIIYFKKKKKRRRIFSSYFLVGVRVSAQSTVNLDSA